jgi:hypothetical protein
MIGIGRMGGTRRRALSSWLFLVVVAAVGGAGSTGCLDDELDPAQLAAPVGTFIALERDFQGFLGWRRIQVGDAVIVDGHAAGPRFAYVSALPAGGSYPIGTMIVKTVETGDQTTWTMHARAKRGGGFNAQGALGWEWFELHTFSSGQTSILWRGEKPPADHGYEALPGLGQASSSEASCNSCHSGALDGDSLVAAPLRAELGR